MLALIVIAVAALTISRRADRERRPECSHSSLEISATGTASLSRGPHPVTADPAALSLSRVRRAETQLPLLSRPDDFAAAFNELVERLDLLGCSEETLGVQGVEIVPYATAGFLMPAW